MKNTTTGTDPVLFDEKMSLPNLNKLLLDLEEWRRHRTAPLHLVCYDIDSLRKINFSYGHHVGDELLHRVAEWVTHISESPLYRIEGDMFCLTMTGKNLAQVQQFATSAMYRSKGPWGVQVEGMAREIFVTAHMAIVPVDDYVLDQNLTDLLERILDTSRNTRSIAVFSREADEINQEYIRLQLELKTSILRDMTDFDLVFQPIVNPATGIWAGMEALSRWQRSDGRKVPPVIFIPEIEKLGLMPTFGLWVLEEAVRTCKYLGLDALEGFFLSVNVSASQMRADFARQVKALLGRQDFPPQKLNLEITESTEFSFNDTTHSIIGDLREIGVTFALDDFGTGYSTFNNMKNLPARYIKTEREFIHKIETDNYLQYSLYVISETAHANGMLLIVEGVETREALRCVMKNGADLIQGYYYSRPVERDVLCRQLERFTTPDPDDEPDRDTNRFNFAKWLKSNDAYNITPGLFTLLNRAMETLLNEESLDAAVNSILAEVGQHFRVNRAFIFLRDKDTIFSNRYEWCAEGFAPQIHLFQGVDISKDGFYQSLTEQQMVITAQSAQLPDDMLCRLRDGGQHGSIQSLAVYPMKSRGEVIGFAGFDDHESREWLPEEMLILHNLCLLVLIKLDVWGQANRQEDR